MKFVLKKINYERVARAQKQTGYVDARLSYRKLAGQKIDRRRKPEQFRIGLQGTGTLGGSPVNMHLYVEDVDAFFKRALAAGTKERKPVMDQFYGDRSGAS